MPTTLTPDAQVPALSFDTVNGDRWTLTDQKPDIFTTVIFYRGYHCPVCKTYLLKIQSLLDDYASAGLSVAAVSMDTEERATKSVEEWGLQDLTIGFGLPASDAKAWGLYLSEAINEKEAHIFCEPGFFWVRPDGRLYLADVSNMPWARPDPEFLLSKIPVVLERQYPARGTYTG